jgi:hypothetical protein
MMKMLRSGMLVFVLSLFAALPLTAQEAGTWSADLAAGATYSSFAGDAFDDSSRSFGLTFGVGVDRWIIDNLGVGLEVNFIQHRTTDAKTWWDSARLLETDMRYVQVPLMATFMLPLGSLEVDLSAGVAANFQTSCKIRDPSLEEREDGEAGEAEDFKVDCPAGIQRGVRNENLFWSVPLGAGVGFEVGEFARMGVDLRYDLGLTNAFDDSEMNSGERFDATIGALVIRARLQLIN